MHQKTDPEKVATCLAWFVFRSDIARPNTRTARSTNGVVHQEAANFLRCPEYCEANLILSLQFSDIAFWQ
jgi:hypothetical protein